MAFTFTVRMAPPRGISQNRSRNTPGWKLGQLKDQWREAWHEAIVQALSERQGGGGAAYSPLQEPMFDEPMVVDIEYQRTKRGNEWDPDNLVAVCKWGLDQLQHTKVVSNDRLLSVNAPTQKQGTRAKLTVTLRTKADADNDDNRVRHVLRDLIELVDGDEYETGSYSWWDEYRYIVDRLKPGDLE